MGLGLAAVDQNSIGVLDDVGHYFPGLGGALEHLPLDVMNGLVTGSPCLEGTCHLDGG